MMGKRAFTLIELLVVIGIIAILAAITFPVYVRAKDSAYRTSDSSNLNQLQQALQVYHADQGGYPPALLGYVTIYTDDNTVVPAEKARGFLYPRRISNVQDFKPAYNKVGSSAYTSAFWPPKDPAVLAAGEDPNHRQEFSTADTVTRPAPTDLFPQPIGGRPITENVYNQSGATYTAAFYNIDGFDIGKVNTGTGTRTELRYTLFWTTWGLGGGNSADDPRQLGYTTPPDDTILTWDSFFREYDPDGNPSRGKRDIALFINGSAKPVYTPDMATKSYRMLP